MDQLVLADRKIQAVAMVSIEAEHPIETDDLVDFEYAIAVWLLPDDRYAIAVVVIVAVGHTIAASSVLEDFHDLYDKPSVKKEVVRGKERERKKNDSYICGSMKAIIVGF